MLINIKLKMIKIISLLQNIAAKFDKEVNTKVSKVSCSRVHIHTSKTLVKKSQMKPMKITSYTISNYEKMTTDFLPRVELRTPKSFAHNSKHKCLWYNSIYYTIHTIPGCWIEFTKKASNTIPND